MAASSQPAKNKIRTSGGGNTEDFAVTPPSFSFSMPPPMKKAKHCHNHRHCGGGAKISENTNNSSINGEGGEELANNKKNGRQLVSPTDVLAHPAAAAAINNGSRRQETAFIKTLPPSLRGINEAAKTLQLSSRSSKNNTSTAPARNPHQQTPQLVAFPTEALYVLTCCVKTTSQKKLLRSNTNDSIIKSRNDSAASSLIGSSSPGSCSFASGAVALGEGEDTPGCTNSSGVGDCGGSGDIDPSTDRKKQAIHYDAVHPPNSSLDHLLSRIGPNQEVSREGAPSVFVLGNKHAQHYCEFSTPKMFAIRPKQRSGSSSQLLKKREEEEKEVGCSEETCSLSSPIKSSQQSLSSSSVTTDWPMTIPPSPKKSCTIPTSTSSSSLFVPVTPKTTSVEGAAANAVTPIAANNTVAAHAASLAKIHAVNFSESYEAFSRLANKFWPGPMIIYAPARMVGGGGEHKGNGSGSGSSTDRKDLRSSPTLQQQQQRTWSRQSSSGSSASSSSSSVCCPSLPSFTNLRSLNTGGATGAVGAMESNSSQVPVLPPSLLIPERNLLPDRDYSDCGSSRENNRFFIGMQCPSHPLSRKLLTEVHRPRGASTSSTSVSTITHSPSTDSLASFSSLDKSPSQQQQIRCGIAVVGSYIQPLTLAATSSPSLSPDGRDDQEDKGNGHGGTILATSASNVKEILSTSPNQSDTEQIRVVNGEDSTREHWSVPTCNYVTHPISLVVDGDNRTIHLLRNRHDGGGGVASGSDYSKEIIYRALLQPSSTSSKLTTASLNMENGNNKGASTTSRSEIDRVITAVLSRWKVVEG